MPSLHPSHRKRLAYSKLPQPIYMAQRATSNPRRDSNNTSHSTRPCPYPDPRNLGSPCQPTFLDESQQSRTHMGHGICCSNFSSPRESWRPWRGAWCAKCYVPTTWDKYPVKVLRKEDGAVVICRLQDKDNFLRVQNGDHLMSPIQCDLCHFRNMKGSDPLMDGNLDRNLLMAIPRINLDSFWGRASSTVSNNLYSMLNIVCTMRNQFGVLSDTSYFPLQGPHPLEEMFGMFAACVMLEHP